VLTFWITLYAIILLSFIILAPSFVKAQTNME